uniref:28S ribosomal protein S7, mitochondrial n=1 Tax=Caligus rogercresseyi TaxID=217165 RepID=C1BPI3_CALRO|nr:28S ribosomal protein S7, mitochondrial precursor [Caligus rogercresseyi]
MIMFQVVNSLKIGGSSRSLGRRCMSKHPKLPSPWPKGYVEPFGSRGELREAKESRVEYEEKLAVKIKAAPNEASVSVFRDPTMDEFSRFCMTAGRREKSVEIMNEMCKKMKEIQHKKLRSSESSSDILLDPTSILQAAIDNCSPLMITTQVPVGSVNYTVPTAIRPDKQRFYGMKWIVDAGRNRSTRKEGEFFAHFVAKEIIEASQNEGKVVSKKEELHRTCYQNRAYVNYHTRRNKNNDK